MTGKSPQSSETALFPFAVVEPALAKTLNYRPDRIKALRARLRYLQRFLGPTSRKGARISYSEEDIWRLLVALRLQESGVDPLLAAGLVHNNWTEKLAGLTRLAVDRRSEGNPVFLALLLRVASGADDEERVSWIGGFRRFDYSLKDARGLPIRRENVDLFLNLMQLGEDGEGDERGALCLHNLTALVKRLRRHLGYEPPPAVKEPSDDAGLARLDALLARYSHPNAGAAELPDSAPIAGDLAPEIKP
jgi:hypothetical protein